MCLLSIFKALRTAASREMDHTIFLLSIRYEVAKVAFRVGGRCSELSSMMQLTPSSAKFENFDHKKSIAHPNR